MSSSWSRAVSRSTVFVTVVLASLGASLGACDDPVTPPADDGKIKQELSAGCRTENDAEAPRKGFQSQTPMIVKGIDRTYDWLVPDAHDGHHPIPIVFVYHDRGGRGADARASFKLEEAIGGKAIVVYPDAVEPDRAWDLEHGPETNADIFFFDQMLGAITDNYCVDTKRVFVAGVSNGAYFANQLGCLRGGSIAAVAAHSGGGPSSADLSATGQLECPQKPVAAIIVHGASDPVVPLTEGQASRDHWTRVNGCRSGGLEVFDPAPCKTQLACAKSRPVVYCEIPGLAHTIWPDAPRAAWNFFSSL
jgi:polyhydroxybutyrate depolymerase